MSDLEAALAAVDAANAEDPNGFDGEPLALVQGRLADEWVCHLDPGAGEALRVAARAHHLRRWVVPRDSYPEGRAGYLRWRRDQKQRHAAELAEILRDCGFAEAAVARAAAIVTKAGLGTDPEVQTFEDAVSLTFLQTQFSSTADRLDDDERMVEVVVKTLQKMSPAGHAAARTVALDDRSADLLARAVEAVGS